MARKVKYQPGWFSDPDGEVRLYSVDGPTGVTAPNRNPESPPGWYRSEGLYQWWNDGWREAKAADDGHHDVARSIGEAIISVQMFGGLDATAISELKKVLSEWPPVRVKSLNTYTSAVVAGTNLVAVVEWDGPES
jgi:hypothetical protein